MVTSFDRFRSKEDGALLVFFALCCAAIFLIAALSFDLGKRASTQTELQSFADNVALAAAGELDGQANAIIRAQTAANQLIVDEMTFGTGDIVLSGSSDFTLAFYRDLPDNEAAWAAPLDQSDRANDALARFVRVQVNPVQVEWSFANLLTLFSSNPLPNENVAAEATGGYTSLACDIAPVFFCMPDSNWNPGDHQGETILLRSGGNSAGWGPGNFGFLDVINMLDYDITDVAGPCEGLNGAPLYNCLIGAESAVTYCFANGQLELLPGQRNGISPSVLNTKFDMFNATNQGEETNPAFRPAPIVTKAYEENSTCAQQAEIDITDTTDFLPDDCFDNGNPGNLCGAYNGVVRYGNGDWLDARLEYVDRNYSVDLLSIGTVNPSEIVMIGGQNYHVDDPFRPEGPNGTNPRPPQYADYPSLDNTKWRWNYYNAEVAAAHFTSPDTVYNSGTGEINQAAIIGGPFRPTPLDLVQVLDPADPDNASAPFNGATLSRSGSSLPHCAHVGTDLQYSLNPRRRTIVSAVVDCGDPNNNMNGSGTATARYFVEVFLQSVSGGTTTNGDFDIYVEPISEPLFVGDPSHANGVFRNLVQLYR